MLKTNMDKIVLATVKVEGETKENEYPEIPRRVGILKCYRRPIKVAKHVYVYYQCYELHLDVNHDILNNYTDNMCNLWANYKVILDLLTSRFCSGNIALALKVVKFYSDRMTHEVMRTLGPWQGDAIVLEQFRIRLMHDIELNPGPSSDDMFDSFVAALAGKESQKIYPKELEPLVQLFCSTQPQMWDPLGIKAFGEVLRDCTDRLSSTAEACVNTTTRETGNIVEDFMQHIKGVIESFKDDIKGAFSFIVVFTTIHYLEEMYDPQLIRVVKMLIAGSALVYLWKTPIKDMIMSWISVIKPQALTGSWTELVVEGLSLLTFGRSINFGSSVTEICEEFAKIERKVDGLSKIINRIIDWIFKLLNNLLELVGLDIGNFFSTSDAKLNRLFREVSELTMELAENPMPSADFMRRLKVLSMKLIDLHNDIDKKDTPNRVLYQRLYDTVKNMLVNFEGASNHVTSRDEPLLFLLPGAPGSGKTYVQSFIAQHLIISQAKTEDEVIRLRDEWQSEVYVMDVDPKHCEQYKGQLITNFPDAFTFKDVAANSVTEPGLLIYMAGLNPLCLPAAEIAKKGKLYFCSKVIMANTNVTYISPNFFPSIRNNDAVLRRLDEEAWYMYVNPEYALRDAAGNIVMDERTNRVVGYENDLQYYGRVDRRRVPEDNDRLIPDLYFFRRFSFKSGTFTDANIYHLEQVKDLAVASLRDKERMSEQRKRLLEIGARESAAARLAQLRNPDVPQGAVHANRVDNDFQRVQDELQQRRRVEAEVEAAAGNPPARRNFPRRRRNAFVPQMRDADGDEFFDAQEFEDIDPAFMEKLRTRQAFFESLRAEYTEEVHSALRVLAVHADEGCTHNVVHLDNEGTICIEDYPERDVPELKGAKLSAFLRLCANDHRTVVLTKRLRAPELYKLSKLDFATAKERIVEYYFYATYSPWLAKIMMNLWDISMQLRPWYEWITASITSNVTPFLQSLETIFPQWRLFVGLCLDIAFWSGITTGLLWLLGYPTGYHCIDRNSSSQVKWDGNYVSKIHDASGYVYQNYSNYAEYEAVISKSYVTTREVEGNKVVVIPRYVSTAQANTLEPGNVDVHTITNNMYILYFQKKQASTGVILTRRNLCCVIFLANKLGLMVNHARKAMEGIVSKRDPDDRYELCLQPFNSGMNPLNSPYTFCFEDVHFIDDDTLQNIDLQPFRLEKMRMHSNIFKKFAPKNVVDYLSSLHQLDGILITKPVHDTLPYSYPRKDSVKFNYTGTEIIYDGEFHEKGVKYSTGYTYKYTGIEVKGKGYSVVTQAGDCMSPGILVDDRKGICVREPFNCAYAGQPLLIYFHTALHGMTPVGVPVFREMFEKYEKEEARYNVQDVVDNINDEVKFVSELTTKHFGTVPQHNPFELTVDHRMIDDIHHTLAKAKVSFTSYASSEIQRSRLYGLEPLLRAPARLRSFIDKETGEYVDVSQKSREKYGSNTTSIPNMIADAVVDSVVSKVFEDSVGDIRPVVLSLDQCIYGDRAHVLKGLNFNSSSGALLRAVLDAHSIPTSGRKWMINEDGKVPPHIMNFLLEYVAHAENKLLTGTPLHAISMDNLKDELLLKAKVKAGKTRLFCSMDLIHLLLCRKWFGAFSGFVAKSKILNGTAICVNAYGPDWDSIECRFRGYSCTFGDYGGYDKKQRAELDPTLKLIHRFYGDVVGTEDYMIREMLYQDIVNSVHLTHHKGEWFIYEWFGGNTSGNFLTAIKNSFTNQCIISYALVCSMLEEKALNPYIARPIDYDWAIIKNNLMIITMGDDIIAGFKGALKKFATFSQLQRCIQLYVGMDFTDELKGASGEVPPFRSIEEGSFIARRFVVGEYKGKRKVFAPLRMYSVIEGVQWIKGRSSPEIETAKLELAFLELSNYPREVFEEKVNLYAPACLREYGLYPQYTTYEVARDRLMLISSERYSFETFDMEGFNLLSDLFKQNLISRKYDVSDIDDKCLEVMEASE